MNATSLPLAQDEAALESTANRIEPTASNIGPPQLLDALLTLRQEIVFRGAAMVQRWQPYIERDEFVPSTLNLAHYLALRQQDLRALQADLAYWGLSSLGRSESHVLPSLDTVIATLASLAGQGHVEMPLRPTRVAFDEGQQLLREQKRLLFGRSPDPRRVRIMVTLPAQAAHDFPLVHSLVKHGMNVARINCAHDDATAWASMVQHVRRAAEQEGRPCTVFMDLAGPKLRTKEIAGLPLDKKRLRVGETFWLLDVENAADPYELKARSIKLRKGEPAMGLTLPSVLQEIELGQSIWFDDGQMGARVIEVAARGLHLSVTHTHGKGERLRADKGINVPGTNLPIPALTDKDRQDLDFVVHAADSIGYSFVQHPEDIDTLHRELAARLGDRPLPPLIIKVETQLAVDNLPDIIVRAAGKHPLGVMIARGDLAVEIGYQRLAEMQEEILWLCESAHVPVIWATQVLEQLAKKGIPSRSEVTDAAMAERAECVMLNKGPYIVDALTTLNDVLVRMQAHQFKKTAQLRALRAWVGKPGYD